MSLEEILFEAEENMEKAIGYAIHEFRVIRTGKASPALIENLNVAIYDTTLKLKQLSLITVPEPRLLLLQPFDIGCVRNIERAIHESHLGLSPVVDGRLIRISIPELSEQRRKELARVVKQIGEESRIRIRACRREALDVAKRLEKAGVLTEDELQSMEEKVQKLTKRFIEEVDRQVETKETELMRF